MIKALSKSITLKNNFGETLLLNQKSSVLGIGNSENTKFVKKICKKIFCLDIQNPSEIAKSFDLFANRMHKQKINIYYLVMFLMLSKVFCLL